MNTTECHTTECPDIAIVGVPKAGTTSLHCWLEQLPGVSAANPKETFYFMDEGNSMVNPKGSYRRTDGVSYDSFFEPPPSASPQLTLDSTTHHFFQQTAVEKFAEHSTKICVVFREPVSRLVSYFNYVGYTRSAFKKPVDFSVFVEKLFDDDMGSLRNNFTDEREFFSLRTALDQGNYQKYLARWLEAVAPENLKVTLFEDLVRDRSKFLSDVATFFDIPITPSDLDDFEVQNEGRGVKFQKLNQWVRSVSGIAQGLPFYDTLKKYYVAAQASEKFELDLDQHRAAIERLEEHYRPLNRQLGEMTSIDLQAWSSKR